MNTTKLFSNLNGISFKGFPNVRWNVIFGRLSLYFQCEEFDRKAKLVSILDFFYSLLFPKTPSYNIEKKSTKGVLLLNNCCDRKTNIDRLHIISDLIQSRTIILGNRLRRRFNIIYTFNILLYMPFWLLSFRKRDIPFVQKLIILNRLAYLYQVFGYIKKNIEIHNYSLFVSYYDSLTEDSFWEELFRLEKIKTASLQHGQFISYRENTEINCGIELRTFKRDFLLCCNKNTKREAVISGIEESKLPILGIIGYASKEHWNRCIKPNNNIFGVVIGHPDYIDENIVLINAANSLSRAKGLKYYLKLHPNYKEDFFKDIVDQSYYLGNIKKGINMMDYANMVDFSIVGASSVLTELVFLGHEVIRYSNQSIRDKYRDIKAGLTFSEPEKIVDAYNIGNFEVDSLFDDLCSIREVRAAYQRFFSTFDA